MNKRLLGNGKKKSGQKEKNRWRHRGERESLCIWGILIVQYGWSVVHVNSWDWRGKQELVLRGLACHAKDLELVRGITHQIYT